MKFARLILFVQVLALNLPWSPALAGATAAATVERKDPIDVWLDHQVEQDKSSAGIRNAMNQARAKWDAELNEVYARLMARLDPGQREALRQSQRDWLRFRDSEFRLVGAVIASKQGTMWQATATGMALEIVRDRVRTLRAYESALDQ